MKTCKKLLAITIALVLLVSTLVSGLVVSAADATTTLAIGTTTIKEGTTTADVEFVLTFAAPTKTPHSLCTITAADGLTLTAIEVDQAKTKYVKQGEDGQWVDDELITDEEAKVTIDNDGKNLAAGKVLVESAADSKAPTVTFITFVATFAVAEGLAEGTYAVSAEADATNWSEDDIAVTVKSGAVVVEAAVVEPDCEHDWVFSAATPATVDTIGELIFVCSKCEEEQVNEVSYYANYKAAYTAADYAAEISLQFSARNDRLAEQGAYDEAFIYFYHVISSSGREKITVKDISEATDTKQGSSNRPCKSWLYGLNSLQLTEEIASNVFVKVGDVWYTGETVPYSMRTYADARLPQASDSEKSLIVNMLTYGAKMQIFKSYNTENLADANLGDYAQYVTTTLPDISATITDNHPTDSVYINKYALDMASRIQSLMYFRSDRYSGANKSDYKVVATWENANGVSKSVEYVAEGKAVDGQGEYTNELEANGNIRANRYTFAFDGLNSYDLRQPVTYQIYDGENEVSMGYTASLEALIAGGIAQGAYGATELAVYNAMLNYSDASRAFFCK